MSVPRYFSVKIRAILAHSWRMQGGGRWDHLGSGFSYGYLPPDTRRSESKVRDAGNSFPPEQGVNKETMRIWSRLDPTKPRGLDFEAVARLCVFINSFLVAPKELSPSDFTDALSVSDFFKKINLTSEEEVSVINSMAFEHGPVGDYVMSKELANSVYNSICGHYSVFRIALSGAKRGTSNGNHVDEGIILSVVGICPISAKPKERSFVVVAKLSIPSVSQGDRYSYWGVVSTKLALHTWHFRQETDNNPDEVFIMTSPENKARLDRERRGHLVTMGPAGSETAAYEVTMTWKGPLADEPDSEGRPV